MHIQSCETKDLPPPMAPEMNLAIARRESEFDPSVQSGAGARGLMQIMPTTASEVADSLDRAGEHTTERLISDPEYNAKLGAAFLSQLSGRFNGNVVLMSAAYNAGPSRVDKWVNLLGDPRQGKDKFDVIEPEAQNHQLQPTYLEKRTPEDSAINAHRSIAEQFDLIRVCDPKRFPAYFKIHGHTYKVYLEKM